MGKTYLDFEGLKSFYKKLSDKISSDVTTSIASRVGDIDSNITIKDYVDSKAVTYKETKNDAGGVTVIIEGGE